MGQALTRVAIWIVHVYCNAQILSVDEISKRWMVSKAQLHHEAAPSMDVIRDGSNCVHPERFIVTWYNRQASCT